MIPLDEVLRQISGIKALCGPSQAQLLYRLVSTISDRAFICEIGCYMGWVTAMLAKACEGSNKRVIMIDWMRGGQCDYPPDIKTQYLEVIDSWLAHDVWKKIIPFPCKSSDAMPVMDLWNPRIELLWVDGDHNYHPVMSDLTNYSKFVPVGGYVCGDDCSTAMEGNFTDLWNTGKRECFAEGGVMQAVWDFFRDNEKFEVLPDVHHSLFGFRRIKP